MTKINELYKAIRKDPSLLSAISNAENKEAAPTRAMPGLSDSAVADALKEILGQDASDQEVNEVMKELENNNLFKLYKASDGTIDAGELLEYAGELDGSGVSKDNTALRALFDGKLDLKEILLIILLLKLFKKKKQPAADSDQPAAVPLWNDAAAAADAGQSAAVSVWHSAAATDTGLWQQSVWLTVRHQPAAQQQCLHHLRQQR